LLHNVNLSKENEFLTAGVVFALLLLLTGVGFVLFPGHTYLYSDSQIYVPIIERLRNPLVLGNDIMATRPFGFSIYDSVAIALTTYTPLRLEHALELQQFIFRGLGAAGVFLIARAVGARTTGAFFIAALVSIGVPVVGPSLGTVESEPVPRGFAVASMLFAVGLAATGRFAWAGVMGSVALLYHPMAAIPFWCVALFAAARKSVRPVILIPLLPAVALLLILAHFHSGAAETADLFHRLDASEAAFERRITPYIFVSEWGPKILIELGVQCAIAGLALWRLRARLDGVLRDFLAGLSLVGVLSIPVSYVVLELGGFAQLQPSRAVLLPVLISGLLACACAVFAADRGAWIETLAWVSVPIVEVTEPKLITFFVEARSIAWTAALLAAMLICFWLARRTRGATLVVAGLLPMVAFPALGLVDNPQRRFHWLEIEQVANWAHENTVEDAVFLFPDSGHNTLPGVFRARAERALYVDWKSRGQANYFPQFAVDWWKRWQDTREGQWIVQEEDFSRLADLRVDYIVVRAEHALPRRNTEFRNSEYVVYRTR
jgi:hypothetical protein